jgi:hypothetical protein
MSRDKFIKREMMTIESAAFYMEKGEFKVPDFQREDTWNASQETAYIRFIKDYNIVPGTIIISDKGQIIDGQHRLKALQKYVNGKICGENPDPQIVTKEMVQVVTIKFFSKKNMVLFFEKINTASTKLPKAFSFYQVSLVDKEDPHHRLACEVKPFVDSRNDKDKKGFFTYACIFATCFEAMVLKREKISARDDNSILYEMNLEAVKDPYIAEHTRVFLRFLTNNFKSERVRPFTKRLSRAYAVMLAKGICLYCRTNPGLDIENLDEDILGPYLKEALTGTVGAASSSNLYKLFRKAGL